MVLYIYIYYILYTDIMQLSLSFERRCINRVVNSELKNCESLYNNLLVLFFLKVLSALSHFVHHKSVYIRVCSAVTCSCVCCYYYLLAQKPFRKQFKEQSSCCWSLSASFSLLYFSFFPFKIKKNTFKKSIILYIC